MASWARPPRKYVLGRDIPWVGLSLDTTQLLSDGPQMQDTYDVAADVFGE